MKFVKIDLLGDYFCADHRVAWRTGERPSTLVQRSRIGAKGICEWFPELPDSRLLDFFDVLMVAAMRRIDRFPAPRRRTK